MPRSFNIKASASRLVTRAKTFRDSYLARRPHRSFRLSKRREYTRSLAIPGYITLTREVNRTVWRWRRIFLLVAVTYAAISGLFIGIGSQETYQNLVSSLQSSSTEAFNGDIGQFGQAGLLFLSIATSGLTTAPTEAQQIYAALFGLLTWLTTVWLLRNKLAGHKVNFRDGLYNAGAPLVPMFLVSLVFLVQLIPLGLALLGYAAASTTGLLDGGVAAMLFWVAAGLLALLSLYWATSTFFALIVVTLPGMYPFRALKIAGDVVVGRRLRLLLRLIWMFIVVALAWALVLIPFILFDSWIKSVWTAIAGVPLVPAVLLVVSTVSLIWTSAYIYILYRKVVDDNAEPA